MQGDALVEAFGISVKEPETVARFLGNFNFKTTQMMMLTHNLFLLFKFDFLGISEIRQQIKTFRLKYVFMAGKL